MNIVLRRTVLAAGLLIPLAGVARAANTADQVCQRWVCDRADTSEGVSTGSVATCDAGDLLPPGRPNALKLVNLYRFLTAMPEVTEDPTFDMNAQECAIIQAANGLTHTPATTATCYNATGANASDKSSICGGQAVGCIDLYMDDSANATGPNFGHRTWILANSLGPVGFGSVGTGRSMTASCFYQVGGTGKAGVPYVGWPPAGPVPLQAFTATELDKSGWSLQSDTINLGAATATVMDGTTNQPVTVSTNLGSYGAKYAMGITPNGWTSQAGHSYTVTIGGTTTPITYTVQVVDCSSYSTSNCAATDGGAGGGSGGATGTGGGPATTGAGGGKPTTGAGGTATTGAGGGPATTGTGGAPAESKSGGCSCGLAGSPAGGAWTAGLLLVALAIGRRRSPPRPLARGRTPPMAHEDRTKTIHRRTPESAAMLANVKRAMSLTAKINRLTFDDADEVRALFSELTRQKVDPSFLLIPPFYTAGGDEIRVGRNVFVNQNCTFYDLGGLDIADDVLIGPNVSLITAGHPVEPSQRRATTIGKPIVIARNVWIAAGATVIGGVTIGENSVVAAGSVVTKDVPPNTLVGGNPARVIRPIGDDERNSDQGS